MRKLVVGIVVIVVLVIVAVGGYYLNGRRQARSNLDNLEQIRSRAEMSAGESVVPPELAMEFDPSSNAGIYQVVEVDRESGAVKLKYIWPKALEGSEIASFLACRAWDYKITNPGAQVPGRWRMFLATLEETPAVRTILSGKCGEGIREWTAWSQCKTPLPTLRCNVNPLPKRAFS